MKTIYCDHAATTPVKEAVLYAMFPYFSKYYGNASAIYSIGKRSSDAIEEAREKVAKAINAKANEIYFTSCGSESDNLALKGFCYANKHKGKHIITSKIEHPAILNTCKTLEKQGFEVTYLNVDKNGFIDFDELTRKCRKDTILISIMTANNEIGTIQPIQKIGEFARSRNIVFHTDSVQAIGNIKIDVEKMNIDMLSMSGHKFYGPKGTGALYVRDGINFSRIQDGGHQEDEKRAGTENVPGIVGLGKAIEIANRNLEFYNKKLLNFREYFIEELEKTLGKENIKLNGDRYNRLPGNCNISFKGIDSNIMLKELDKRGICASGGSACSAGCGMPSYVLQAIQLEEKYLNSAIRFTFGEENTKEEIEYIVRQIKVIINS